MTTAPIYDFQDTWDNGATTFRALQVTVTDTGSAADSKLFDFIIGSDSKGSLDKDGNLAIDGALSAPSIAGNVSFTGSPDFSGIGNVASVRQDLGLEIGVDVLGYDANLQQFVTTFTLPTVDGVAGQVPTTDGAGVLTFQTPAGGGDVLAAANETVTGVWQFSNGFHVGNPDTTIARVSAGDISVEGNIVYRAGGTDVPVADGGTGASTAADARVNLGLDGAIYDTTVEFLSDLEAISPGAYRAVNVLNRATDRDTGGGVWAWLPGSQGFRIREFPAKTIAYAGDTTNGIRNPRAEGATGSTAPTHWFLGVTGGGLSAEYTRTIREGVPGVLARFYGTSTGGTLQLLFDSSTFQAAASGETWTASAYFELVSGSLSDTLSIYIDERDSGGGFEQRSDTALTLDGTLRRQHVTRALNDADTAFVVSGLVGAITAGAQDFTVFIGGATLDESANLRPVCLPEWGTPAVSTQDDLFECIGHNLYTGEKVYANNSEGGLTAGSEYWVERVNQFQFRLHTSLLSCYDQSARVATSALGGTLTVARLRDPGKAIYCAPSSDPSGNSGIWRRLANSQFVQYTWAGATNTETARAEALQNAVNALEAGTVYVTSGGQSMNAPTRISRSSISLVGQDRGQTFLQYNSSTYGGVKFAHPDAGETSERLSNVALRSISVTGNNAAPTIEFDQCAFQASDFTASGGYYAFVARGCQLSSMRSFNAITFATAAGAACVRHEEKPLYGGESYLPSYTTRMSDHLLIGDTTQLLAASVTNITQANPAVVTCNVAHTLSTGDEVFISGLTGMDEVEDRIFKVVVLSTTTFSLQDPYTGADINSTGYVAYTSGGKPSQVFRADYLLSVDRADGLEVDQVYYGSCRLAYVHFGTERDAGATDGIFGVRFSNMYFDGVDFTGVTGRSPKHIWWVPSDGESGNRVGIVQWSNTHFANNRSKQAEELVKIEDSAIDIQFVNCQFTNSEEELITIDNGGTAIGDYLFANCVFADGGEDGSHDMVRINGAQTVNFAGGVFRDATSGNARVRLEGTIDQLVSTASFQGTTADFDVAGTVNKASIAGTSDATSPYQPDTYSGDPIFVFATPGTAPTYSTRSANGVKSKGYVKGDLFLSISNKGTGSGGVDIRLPSSFPVAARNTAVTVVASSVTAGVLDRGIFGRIIGATRDIRLELPDASGFTPRLDDADLTNSSTFTISFEYPV